MSARSGTEDDLLTSAEAARHLGVSAASVKRWTDAGALSCVRTAGGHRRFVRAQLDAFRRKLQRASKVQCPNGPHPSEQVESWMQDLLDEDPYALEARFLYMRAQGGSWWQVATALGPVIRELGAAWERGEINVVEEHLASERFARTVARIVERLQLPAEAPRVLLATAEGDEHSLGLSLLELCLRELGQHTLWSGPRTPVTELAPVLSEVNAWLVCVSASIYSGDAGLLARHVRELEQICEPQGVALVLGGQGAWPERTAYARTMRSFAELRSFVLETYPP